MNPTLKLAIKSTGSHIHILFVCSKNTWRSPTAERIYSRHPLIQVRSAGTTSDAKRTVSASDIQWADLIMVMENKHLARLRADFADLLRSKKCYVLDIPDEYRYMDDDLIQELRSAIDPIIDAAIPLEREDPEALCP